MRLREEAPLAVLRVPQDVRSSTVRDGLALSIIQDTQTERPDGADEPTGELNRTQWLCNYVNQTASIINTPESNVKQFQQLHLITNNNLDNARSVCDVIADDNSNHRENDNRAVLTPASQHMQRHHALAEDTISSMSVSSPDDSLVGDCEDSQRIISPVDISPAGDEEDSGGESSSSSDSLLSDTGEEVELGSRQGRPLRRVRTGILNPNYPGFQRYAKRLHFVTAAQEEDEDENEEDSLASAAAESINNNDTTNNNKSKEELNRLDEVAERIDKSFVYDKSTLNIPVAVVEDGDVEKGVEDDATLEIPISDDYAGFVDCCNKERNFTFDCAKSESTERSASMASETSTGDISAAVIGPIKHGSKMVDAYLSGAIEEIGIVTSLDPNKIVSDADERMKSVLQMEEKMETVSEDVNRETSATKCKTVFFPHQRTTDDLLKVSRREEEEKFMREDVEKEAMMREGENVVPKKEKMEINYGVRMTSTAKYEATTNLQESLPNTTPGPDVISTASAFAKDSERRSSLAKKNPTPTSKTVTPLWAHQVTWRKTSVSRNLPERRSAPAAKRKTSPDALEGGFDVYNIETSMPSIDLDAIESHLQAAKEEETRRRNDREEIRRRLAMGPEADDFYGPPGERQGGRKPSLQSRLQSGMNLQICFMNETASDGESPVGSECESPLSSSPTPPSTLLSSSLPSFLPSSSSRHRCHAPAQEAGIEDEVGRHPANPTVGSHDGMKPIPPRSLSLKSTLLSRSAGQHPSRLVGGVVGRWDILGSGGGHEQHPIKWDSEDFFGRQARLQAEARVALAQAKEMAHMQMEVERQRQKVNSPITQMVRASLMKVGLMFPADRRRVSRQMLTEMNVAQLQVIVNDLHTQIEVLNEDLVKLLMERDDLHMEQDSMLVDIEDLTRYLGAKEKAMKESGRAGIPNRGLMEDGSRGVGSGSLPSLPLIFRHARSPGGIQSGRSRMGLLSKK